MMQYRKCIFHIPNAIDKLGTSGSQVRPQKMLKAFENIGYEVDVVMGYGKQRKGAVEKIKANIKNGAVYDFLYSESSTMPTLLTEKNHFPLYPNLDFGFFSFCKKHNIPIGLFYRDIHWRFDAYKKSVSGIKRFVAKIAYEYDLYRYTSLLDYLYYPSKGMEEYIPIDNFQCMRDSLPSGAIYDEYEIKQQDKKFSNMCKKFNSKIKLFYVGGVSGIYKFQELLKGLKDLNFIKLTICCRETEWELVRKDYEKFLTDNIIVVHKFGKELEKYYSEADICVAFFEPSAYMNMAMPVKIFEYLGHTIPIISTKNTAFGNFVENNEIGWSIEYDAGEFKKLMLYLYNNFNEITIKHQNSICVLRENTWEGRAKQVQEQLLRCKGM